MTGALVVAVHRSATHRFSKVSRSGIHLIEGIGVEGDAHAGATVQHRSRVARDPSVPNLRQVHLMHAELFDELLDRGYEVLPGQLGENVTTRGLDLLGLPAGTRLLLGDRAVVELTGLRNPCKQIDGLGAGLMAAVLARDDDGNLVRKAGVMAVVVRAGEVRPADLVAVSLPALPHHPLQPV